MTVPFLNLRAAHDPLRDEFTAVFHEVIDSSAFAGGPFVQKFEEDFAPYCQCEHALGVGNGTDALWLALLALGIGPGDEVITACNSFIATAEAISYCGATPRFVDVDERTYTMDPSAAERAITPKTRAIIPVHLYGQMADMDPILDLARRRGLFVVEDAAQAQGAEYKGRRAGSIGDAGCFSFYPGKNLGALGEGGAVVTHDPKIAGKVRCLREHGQTKKYHHDMIGWNCRMDGIQGALLRIKLRHLDRGNESRRAHARHYTDRLQGVNGIVTPHVRAEGLPIFHLYVIRVKNRDGLIQHLSARGIGSGIHYPVPLHLTEAYRGLGQGPGSCPVAERCASEIISLPMFPELTPEQVDTVVDAVRDFCRGE